MRKLLKSTLLCSLLVWLASCRTAAPPPDINVCTELSMRQSVDPKTKHVILTPSPLCEQKIGEPSCGVCSTIISNQVTYVGELHPLNGSKWSEVKATAVMVPAASWADLNKYMVDNCYQNSCNQAIDQFRVNVGE